MKWIVFLILCLGLSVYFNQKFYFQSQKIQTELAELRENTRSLENDLNKVRSQSQTRIEEEKLALQNIENLLQKKSGELANLLERLKGTNDVELGGNNPSTMEWDIRHEKEVIGNLASQIRDVKTREAFVSDQTKIAQSQDKSLKVQNENELQVQINYQEQNLREDQNRLTQARADHLIPDTIRRLQDQVNQQRNFVNGLKTQKQNITRSWNVAADHVDMKQSLALLKTDESNLNNQLQIEKANLDRLQKNLSEQQKVSNQHRGQMSQLQRDIQNKRQEIADLQNQLSALKSN